MRSLVTGSVLAIAVLLAGGMARAQGIYWESTTTIKVGGETTMNSQTYAMPKMLKHVSEKGEEMIIRLDQQAMYALQPSEKTYWKMTFAEMEAMMKKAGAKMDDAMKEMEAAMKEMSPEQRKMMESMMGDKLKGVMGGGPVDVSETGESKQIAGYPTTQYVATRDGEQIMAVWTTQDVREFAAMRKDWQEFNRRLLSMNPSVGKGLMEAFQKIDGFPMETDIMGSHTVVTKVEHRAIPESTFEIPAGYTQVDAPSLD
jgi:hypothetical protein